MPDADPIDGRRLARLYLAASAVLERPDRHTPLERQWAKEVFDLATALQHARDELGVEPTD